MGQQRRRRAPRGGRRRARQGRARGGLIERSSCSPFIPAQERVKKSPLIPAEERVKKSAHSRVRGNPAFAKPKILIEAKAWILASESHPRGRTGVAVTRLLHTLASGNPPSSKDAWVSVFFEVDRVA